MSTSVFFKPIAHELPSRMRTLDRKFYNRDPSPKVRRALFGPIDHVETRRMVDQELTKLAIEQANKWNFDFANETPVNSTQGRFVWSRITSNYAHPTRPFKQQQRVSIIENDDEGPTIDLYYESMMVNDVLLRPRALKPSDSSQVTPPEESLSLSHNDRFNKTQRLITDFMPSKKRSLPSTSAFVKRLEKSPAARPSKLQRTHKNNTAS